MTIKPIFFDPHGELRSGWRIVAFILITGTITLVFVFLFQFLDVRGHFVGEVVILVSVLIGSYITARFINHKPFGAIGLNFHPAMYREFGTGCLLGFLMMSGIFVVQYSSGFVQLMWMGPGLWDTVWVLSSSVSFFAIGAFAEEVLFRGYLFQTLIQGITALPAMVLMGILFALAHLANPHATTFALINVGLAAVLLSIAYLKTRSLWLPFGLHLGWNYSQTTLYSFPTSGIQFTDMKLLVLTQSGPEWLTGGDFGPEGGMFATTALIAATWYVLKSKKLAVPDGIITLDSVEDLMEPHIRSEGQVT